jgi:hypothetical protein
VKSEREYNRGEASARRGGGVDPEMQRVDGGRDLWGREADDQTKLDKRCGSGTGQKGLDCKMSPHVSASGRQDHASGRTTAGAEPRRGVTLTRF